MELAQSTPELPLLRRLSPLDWLAALLLSGGGLYALATYGAYMDAYEKGILLGAIPVFVSLAWRSCGIRNLLGIVALLALSGIALYHGELARAEQAFMLKFFLSSQTAIGWMCALFFMSTIAYWFGLLARSDFAEKTGSALTWCATAMGATGMLVRWYESYLIGTDVGHIPVSNLYEVFVLFCLITALLYLHYERHYATRRMGAFVLLVISSAVGFLLWYTFSREAYEIQPLIPALQSYWMKIHVPANFIGYGAFALAAMVGVAWLLRERGILASRLPEAALLEDVMYRAISIGFAFFTVATILGALWAAEAWGTYWQWDPKETWALIVWLNYAAWLHMRLTKGLRGAALAWWAVVGLVVVTFAFLGVNMFLSGLHSYGSL
jgi:cytochrome c-type biogenesis protein CcsB